MEFNSVENNELRNDVLPQSENIVICLDDYKCKDSPVLTVDESDSSSQNSLKRVTFRDVEIFYFERVQGYICVPSQGGSTLGMAGKHFEHERTSIIEFEHNRRSEKYAAILRKYKSGKTSLMPNHLKLIQNFLHTKCPPSLGDEDEDGLAEVLDCYFLQLLSVKKRRGLLRRAGKFLLQLTICKKRDASVKNPPSICK